MVWPYLQDYTVLKLTQFPLVWQEDELLVLLLQISDSHHYTENRN